MLFNSLEYFIFLPTVFLFYWFIKDNKLKKQNLLILISSYAFYAWWDWRFLSLIFISTLIDYFTGLRIDYSKSYKVKKLYLCLSIIINLSLLGFFKYYNFFINSWVELLSSLGYEQKSLWTINVILPVGISFYTFQTISYSLDIYYKKLKPTKDFIAFAAFVSFFPQLIAGPIERASNLLPQLLKKRVFIYRRAVEGLRLILWGLFKKVVIADSLAWRVDNIFNNFQNLDGGVLLLGLIYFSFQIYCDFSGYSDIAIGTAKLFGIELMSNFKFPYFSRNISEFWGRWHISLSSWFRDYLYIPLGGSRIGTWISIRNIMIIFILSGLWHGANWTFIVWGALHGLYLIIAIIAKQPKKYLRDILGLKGSFIYKLWQVGITFILVLFAWIFFRANSINDALYIIQHMFIDIRDYADIEKMKLKFRGLGIQINDIIICLILIFFMEIYHLYERTGDVWQKLSLHPRILRWSIYYIIMFSILFLGPYTKINNFIYFQF